MARKPSTPWGGDDIPLETEDEYRQRRSPSHTDGGERVLDLGESGPDLQTIHEAPRRAAKKRGPGGRLIPLFGLALLSLITWEIGASLWQHRVEPPTDADWRAAVAHLERLRKTTDPVLVAPAWVEPVARVHLRGILDLDMAGLSDVDRFPSVYELSIRGARHPWLRGLTPQKSWSHGAVTLSLFTKAKEEILYDFRRSLGKAQVTLAPPLQPCRHVGKRFLCRGGALWVGDHLAEVGHRPYRAIYAHPVVAKRLRVDYADVPLGKKIVGYTGVDDFENRKRAKGPVRLQVFVGDKLVADIHHENAWPWHRFEADTSAFSGKRLKVRFEITSAQPKHRTFCFHAEARR